MNLRVRFALIRKRIRLYHLLQFCDTTEQEGKSAREAIRFKR